MGKWWISKLKFVKSHVVQSRKMENRRGRQSWGIAQKGIKGLTRMIDWAWCLIMISLIMIGLTLSHSEAGSGMKPQHPLRQNSTTENSTTGIGRAGKILSAVLVVFIMTWLPYNILVILKVISCNIPDVAWKIAYYLCPGIRKYQTPILLYNIVYSLYYPD